MRLEALFFLATPYELPFLLKAFTNTLHQHKKHANFCTSTAGSLRTPFRSSLVIFFRDLMSLFVRLFHDCSPESRERRYALDNFFQLLDLPSVELCDKLPPHRFSAEMICPDRLEA